MRPGHLSLRLEPDDRSWQRFLEALVARVESAGFAIGDVVEISVARAGGPQCKQHGCNEEALFEVFWPGRSTKQCTRHALALANLGVHMGFKVECRPLVDFGAPSPL